MTSSPLCWVGGKSKLKKRIIAKIPPHKTYVEPFVGGGHVFFAKESADKNVINDLDKDLINFYRDLKNNGCKTSKSCKLPKTKKEFEKLKDKTPCGFIGRTKKSFGCNRKKFYDTRNGIEDHKKQCGNQQAKLKNTNILNEDYEKVIKKHNSKSTFVYLDPPYVGSEDDYITKNSISPERICKSLKGFKGKFILSYNNHPRVRKACKKFKISEISTSYSSKTMEQKPVKELLISNY